LNGPLSGEFSLVCHMESLKPDINLNLSSLVLVNSQLGDTQGFTLIQCLSTTNIQHLDLSKQGLSDLFIVGLVQCLNKGCFKVVVCKENDFSGDAVASVCKVERKGWWAVDMREGSEHSATRVGDGLVIWSKKDDSCQEFSII
jgi:hypothetical protein